MAQTVKKNTSSKDGLGHHIRTFWKIFALLVGVVILVFLFASWGLFGSLPDETSLENPEKNLATEIISSDGKTIGKFYKENRTPVPFEWLPDPLVNALIATEDARFYDHSGIDGRGTARALIFMGSRGGASTISQQLAKTFFYRPGFASNKIETCVSQKVKEWIIATRLETTLYKSRKLLPCILMSMIFLTKQ